MTTMLTGSKELLTPIETISVIGLGYVGLPVATAFARKFRTIGFDINKARIAELQQGFDRTYEVMPDDLRHENLELTDNAEALRQATFHIITVPTPIDDAKRPDLRPVYSATETVACFLKKGDMVVYESTVYPGLTEEECIPRLEKISGLKFGRDFKVGYSPERINPGDKNHNFRTIKKVVSGNDSEALERIATLYGAVVEAGVYKAASIKVAEAAKVIENTQRDLNVALINELSLIFDRLDIDTYDVLDAAGTKWNFLKFQPGLVGGHCIGVDPYYLTHKAESVGYKPQVILSGRQVNDNMGQFIAQKLIKRMSHLGCAISSSTVTILGATFKENCPDTRNSKVFDMIKEFESFAVNVQVCDPMANAEEVYHEYGVKLTEFSRLSPADAIVVAVGHQQYKELGAEHFKTLSKTKPIVFDIKGVFDKDLLRSQGVQLYRL